jgi:beta-glucosidase
VSAFREDFIWGASTASYQIEGAWNAEGKGPSIWDTFTHTPGKIAGGDTGDTACNHYRRYREDVALMKELGLDAYRFSTSWPRIFPEGRGKANPRGLDFYERLIDALLEADIAPWLCFYHWDLPQALQDKGGWTNRDIAHWFSDYAVYVADRFGDRVEHFLILNEPNAVAFMGHFLGQHAPGLTDFAAFGAAVHHLNLAQGEALAALRDEGDWRLGTILNLQPVHAAGDSSEDEQAARMFDAVSNRNHLDPLFFGRYPDETMPMLEPYIKEGDMARIRQKVDFLGLNLYTRFLVQADPASLVGMNPVEPPSHARVTDMGWEVYPRALYEQLMDLKHNYGNPVIYITENGAAFADEVGEDGEIRDVERIRFLEHYLEAAQRALSNGANLKGYFVWSLMDNFEWAEGYTKRFGLVYVDYKTLQRRPKASYYWYAALIREGKLSQLEVA